MTDDNALSLLDDPTDAYPPEPDPDGELVALILSKLFQAPAADRIRAVAALTGKPASQTGRLGWVLQLSVMQLSHEGVSFSDIGEIMGVTKASAYQVWKGRAIEDAAYAWGRLLSTVSGLAFYADRANGRRGLGHYEHGECGQMVELGMQTTTVRPRLLDTGRRYAGLVKRHAKNPETVKKVEALLARMEELDAQSQDLAVGVMPMDDRAQTVKGYYHEKTERRDVTSAEPIA